MTENVWAEDAVMDESSWVYLAAHHRDDEVDAAAPFSELLAGICERFGFTVYATGAAEPETETSPPHWIDAVRQAEICVIDVGATSVVAGAELALAWCSGRPLVALRAQDEPLPPALASLTLHHHTVREVVFTDAEDCVAQLGAVLADPSWQASVRRATPQDDV